MILFPTLGLPSLASRLDCLPLANAVCLLLLVSHIMYHVDKSHASSSCARPTDHLPIFCRLATTATLPTTAAATATPVAVLAKSLRYVITWNKTHELQFKICHIEQDTQTRVGHSTAMFHTHQWTGRRAAGRAARPAPTGAAAGAPPPSSSPRPPPRCPGW